MPRKTAAQKAAEAEEANVDVEANEEEGDEDDNPTENRNSPLSIETLNKGDQEELKRLLSKAPQTMAQCDRDFLKARRAYLTKEQIKDYCK